MFPFERPASSVPERQPERHSSERDKAFESVPAPGKKGRLSARLFQPLAAAVTLVAKRGRKGFPERPRPVFAVLRSKRELLKKKPVAAFRRIAARTRRKIPLAEAPKPSVVPFLPHCLILRIPVPTKTFATIGHRQMSFRQIRGLHAVRT